MDCPSALAHDETLEAFLFRAATLHRHGLPHDYAKLENLVIPETYACCSAPLWDPGLTTTRAYRIFVRQSHLGRCGGDSRRHQAREAVKLAMKCLVVSKPDRAGCAFPKESILIEPPHLRLDNQVTTGGYLCSGKWITH